MQQMFLVKYGEIILKGLNRRIFEDKLISNIKKSLSSLGNMEVYKEQAAIYIRPLEKVDNEKVIDTLKKIFGIVNISNVVEIVKDLEIIKETTVDYLKDKMREGTTFKVETKRADKRFPYKSPDISAIVGGHILQNIDGIKVDVKNPDITVNIEIRNTKAFIYTDKIKGSGGLPVGVSGRSCLLLSGGIDSPVAGWMIAKRGVEVEAVHFISPPYTSDRAKEKVIELAKIISKYCGKMRLHIVPFTDIQLAIHLNCPEEQLTIIMRRIMMKISEIIAVKNNCESLITGESLGQVASQTMQSISVTNAMVDIPVFRPLIGMDKEEIMQKAKIINTYETSILPYEDCCTIFVPKHPNTKPKISAIEKSEKNLDMEKLVKNAVDGTETIIIN